MVFVCPAYTLCVNEHTLHKIDDQTLLLLNRLVGDASQLVPCVETRDEFHDVITKVDLPIALGGEYFFRLWFYKDGERQISAHLVPRCSNDTYFWYQPFEMNEFKDSEHGVVIEFCKELEVLLTHETRIIQRKGWLSWHFDCEYHAGEEWKSLYRHSALRSGGFRPPEIEGRRRVYHSAPIRKKDCSACLVGTLPF